MKELSKRFFHLLFQLLSLKIKGEISKNLKV